MHMFLGPAPGEGVCVWRRRKRAWVCTLFVRLPPPTTRTPCTCHGCHTQPMTAGTYCACPCPCPGPGAQCAHPPSLPLAHQPTPSLLTHPPSPPRPAPPRPPATPSDPRDEPAALAGGRPHQAGRGPQRHGRGAAAPAAPRRFQPGPAGRGVCVAPAFVVWGGPWVGLGAACCCVTMVAVNSPAPPPPAQSTHPPALAGGDGAGGHSVPARQPRLRRLPCQRLVPRARHVAGVRRGGRGAGHRGRASCYAGGREYACT